MDMRQQRKDNGYMESLLSIRHQAVRRKKRGDSSLGAGARGSRLAERRGAQSPAGRNDAPAPNGEGRNGGSETPA